ncbi:hypothetical protein ACIBG0_33625 [Nocardia sp. NPDC050630]|uniref:hypothetical protein n=1 Tax=Nocardia sp. NPDC050630 TaxID=3364321 RepID=UPI0037BBC2EB
MRNPTVRWCCSRIERQRLDFSDPQQNEVSRADAEDIVIELSKYHGMFWESPRFTMDLAGLHPTLVWQQDLNRKIAFTRRVLVGLERSKDIVPGSIYDQRGEIYPAYLRGAPIVSQRPANPAAPGPALGQLAPGPQRQDGPVRLAMRRSRPLELLTGSVGCR